MFEAKPSCMPTLHSFDEPWEGRQDRPMIFWLLSFLQVYCPIFYEKALTIEYNIPIRQHG